MIVVLVMVVLFASMAAKADCYPTILMVVDITGDTVTGEDFCGFLWQWTGAEDIFEGDMVAAIMDDCDTARIEDDKIIDLCYCGWIKGWEEKAR